MAPKINLSISVSPGSYCKKELGRALVKHLVLNEHSMDSLVKKDFSVSICGERIHIVRSTAEIFDDTTWAPITGIDWADIQ